MKKFLVRLLLVMTVTSLALTSCKAWRTVSTSATYVQQNDTSKTTTTIQTKTTESYDAKKNLSY